jgi:hypothetical protein
MVMLATAGQEFGTVVASMITAQTDKNDGIAVSGGRAMSTARGHRTRLVTISREAVDKER